MSGSHLGHVGAPIPTGKMVREQLAVALEHGGLLAIKLPQRDEKKRVADDDLRLRIQRSTPPRPSPSISSRTPPQQKSAHQNEIFCGILGTKHFF